MLKSEILSTRKFRESFYRHISLHPIRIRIAVPFVGKIPGFGTLADFARVLLRENNVSMELITRPPDANSATITQEMAEAVVAIGVELVVRHSPPLHSKVYQVTFANGERAAYVGSANLTEGGFNRNDETMALLRSVDENHRVELELDRLSNYGAVPYRLWKAKNASKSKLGERK